MIVVVVVVIVTAVVDYWDCIVVADGGIVVDDVAGPLMLRVDGMVAVSGKPGCVGSVVACDGGCVDRRSRP